MHDCRLTRSCTLALILAVSWLGSLAAVVQAVSKVPRTAPASKSQPEGGGAMRASATIEDRQRSEDAFYGSDEWKNGPREAILADIASYTTIVVQVDDATLQGMRKSMLTGRGGANMQRTETLAPSDLAKLLELNQDYIRSVQNGDVQRFKEILAEDFLCSLPDGSLIDRDRFLEQTARPVQISNLQAHDVNVRLMGDFAIVHARTTYAGPDGRPGSGRYTDVWARRNGQWLAVSAHVTRN
jgi:ketosteroid isomerase-like protein